MLSTEQVRDRLKDACDQAGSQAAWARRHGMSAAYLHDVINGRRGLGQRILDALGLERQEQEVQYAPKNGKACDHQSGTRAAIVPKRARR